MGLLTQNEQQYYDSGNSGNYGNYQFVSLRDIITGFMVQYVGESKLLTKVNRNDVQYHAMRAIQEFSYDTFKSFKAQEITVPNTLKMILPQDYVNYTKLTRVGDDGIERTLYPTGKTSNPTSIKQDANGVYEIADKGVNRVVNVVVGNEAAFEDGYKFSLRFLNEATGAFETLYVEANKDADSLTGYDSDSSQRILFDIADNDTASTIAASVKAAINKQSKYHTAVSEGPTVTITYNQIGGSSFYEVTQVSAFTITTVVAGSNGTNSALDLNSESTAWSRFKSTDFAATTADDFETDELFYDASGRRYGLDPQHAQNNGSFYIDQSTGYIHFGSNLAGVKIVLHYISDGLGTDSEMVVHKFAEEAVYKWIAYGIISARSNMPEYVVQRFKKERFAAARKAKIRLSNIKIEEFAQVLKGQSKPIK